ncbi:helix-turn-helix domain-containing protein [Ruegeria sp. 2012CJ15-1]
MDKVTSNLRSTDARDFQHVSPRVSAMAKDIPDGHVIAGHCHPRDQLLFAVAGVMRVETARNAWIVPPDRALFLPAEEMHAVEARGNLKMRTLYITHDADSEQQVKVLRVTPLMRELILALIQNPVDYSGNSRAERIADLIRLEMEAAESLPANIPLPSDPRLQNLCARVLRDPSDVLSMDLFAAGTGASTKTLARLCQSELGMTFGAWRRRVRFAAAAERLEQGVPIKIVARDAGYRSSSAFAYAFRQYFGLTPSEFRSGLTVVRI